MSLGHILLLAVALAMDATAVAAARGLAATTLRARDVVLTASLFGGFQALMPALGWLLGAQVGALVDAYAGWIAFAILTGIGVKMLLDARKPRQPSDEAEPFALRALLLLAVATSLDAFAAGISLAMLDADLVPSIVTIGVVTALLSAGGVLAGRRLGAALGRRLEVAGGVALILIGLKSVLSPIA